MTSDPDPASSRPVRRAPRLTVDVCDAEGRPAARTAPGLATWLQRVAPASAHGVVTLALVGNARMRTLNREYRGKDYATDVLSFPAEHTLEAKPRNRRRSSREVRGKDSARAPRRRDVIRHLGDVVIATGVAARQARDAGHSVATELRVLALHGLLHLLGYDHEQDQGDMARLERRLRRRGGLREGLIERAV
jgi:probable rRNA maturation factor